MKKVLMMVLALTSLAFADDVWSEAAEGINVDPALLYSIGINESSLNPNSVNYNKMSPEKRDTAIAFFKSIGVKTQAYGNKKQHLSISCKSRSCAIKAINYALNNGINLDVGVMNINSIHFKELSKYGITPYDLLDAKLNIKVGAWELKGCINRYGYTTDAINCYNGMSYENRVLNKYASKIYNTMQKVKRQQYVAYQHTYNNNGENETEEKTEQSSQTEQKTVQNSQPSFLAFEKVN